MRLQKIHCKQFEIFNEEVTERSVSNMAIHVGVEYSDMMIISF